MVAGRTLMCNLYSIMTNQAAIAALFRVVNRYVGNLQPMPGVFPDYPAPVMRNAGAERELTMMRWRMPPPSRTAGPPVTNIRNTVSPHWRAWLEPKNRCLVPANSFAEYSRCALVLYPSSKAQECHSACKSLDADPPA
jgi:putative SOS response-associated peptidase YedK